MAKLFMSLYILFLLILISGCSSQNKMSKSLGAPISESAFSAYLDPKYF